MAACNVSSESAGEEGERRLAGNASEWGACLLTRAIDDERVRKRWSRDSLGPAVALTSKRFDVVNRRVARLQRNKWERPRTRRQRPEQ